MPQEHRPRERELVLAPNEFAYVLDTTKGHINCYVGPNKTSLAQTDQLVILDSESQRFSHADLQTATQLFVTAPANWYLVLQNPAKDQAPGRVHPSAGQASAMVDLDVGTKTMLAGPCSFPLWPGQIARVIEGHRLNERQYVVVQVNDAAKAEENRAQTLGGVGLNADIDPDTMHVFTTGSQFLIKGCDVSFYIPPDGVEVIPDASGSYLREAVALRRLEYCTLINADGSEQTVRGEAVVFPDPNQQFSVRNGQRKFNAIELSAVTGVHVKVIKPYLDDDGTKRNEGEELFISGAGKLYFPRQEHALIRYGNHQLHHAIAIPAGAGRYVLNRTSGEVSLVRGPRMFLADPRQEVLVQRQLSDDERTLLFPATSPPHKRAKRMRSVPQEMPMAEERVFVAKSDGKEGTVAMSTEALSRAAYVPPRSLVLEQSPDAAVSIEVRSGEAVQIVDRRGGRRVEQGPLHTLLAFDEHVEPLVISRGRPKQTTDLLRVAYLRLAGNKVSDLLEVVSSDLVESALLVKYRVRFEGEDPSQWFRVQNYVQLVCDRAGAAIKSATRQVPVRDLRANVSSLVEEAVLGAKGESGQRPGMAFDDNNMRITDVEVLEFDIDDAVGPLLQSAQTRAIQSEITLVEKERQCALGAHVARLEQSLARARHQAKLAEIALAHELLEKDRDLDAERERKTQMLLELERATALRSVELQHQIESQRLATEREQHEAKLHEQEAFQALALREHAARVEGLVQQAQAFSPHLVQALQRLGDEQLLSSLSENFGELSAIEGKGLLETAKKFLDFAPASVLPSLRVRAAVNAEESN